MRSGASIGGVVITVYFTAGGLLTSAWVNVVQLAVKLGGFAIARAAGARRSRRMERAVARCGPDDAAYWTFVAAADRSGVMYLALLTPAFIVSPGLLQKIFGARDDRAVRLGVGLNALGLLLYAGVPVAARHRRARHVPDARRSASWRCRSILMHGAAAARRRHRAWPRCSRRRSAPPTPVLFMLTTSLSQDLYKRFVNPAAERRARPAGDAAGRRWSARALGVGARRSRSAASSMR